MGATLPGMDDEEARRLIADLVDKYRRNQQPVHPQMQAEADRITRQWPAELHEQAHGLYLRSVLAALAGLDMARLLATEATETRTDLQGVAQLGDPNPS